MTSENHPHDTIYIEFGKFKAGATGRIAVTFFVLLFIAAGATKLFGMW